MIGFSRVTNYSPTPSGAVTPSIGTVGLGLTLPTGPSFMEAVHTTNVWNKISSIPTTPTIAPTGLAPLNIPELTNPFNNPQGDAIQRLTTALTEIKTTEVTEIKPSYSWVVTKDGRHK
jgi:hypothetical protein